MLKVPLDREAVFHHCVNSGTLINHLFGATVMVWKIKSEEFALNNPEERIHADNVGGMDASKSHIYSN